MTITFIISQPKSLVSLLLNVCLVSLVFNVLEAFKVDAFLVMVSKSSA